METSAAARGEMGNAPNIRRAVFQGDARFECYDAYPSGTAPPGGMAPLCLEAVHIGIAKSMKAVTRVDARLWEANGSAPGTKRRPGIGRQRQKRISEGGNEGRALKPVLRWVSPL
jgi:hypothetical protein